MIGERESLARLAAQLKRRRRSRLPALLLLTDSRRLPDPLPAVARLPRGAAVILRHYDSPGRAALAGTLAALCRRRGLYLLIAEDGRLAARVGADGLHLPERAITRLRYWRGRHHGWLMTAAAHSLPALRAAVRAGADAALLAPVFATLSHPGAPVLGVVRFSRLARASPIPVYALGGITAQTARRLAGSAAGGLAAIAALAEL